MAEGIFAPELAEDGWFAPELQAPGWFDPMLVAPPVDAPPVEEAFGALAPAERYGREPLTIVELYQPRCALRYGVAPCTASGGTPCYQTWTTCGDRPNIDLSGSLTWRFRAPDAGILPMYEEAGEHIKTNPLPILESVSARASELNVGGIRDGKSALGLRAGVTVRCRDMNWDDHVGDFSLGARPAVPRRMFWPSWKARNVFTSGMQLRHYTGYRGQTLAEMTRSDYVLEVVNGPNGGGGTELRGRDPLALTEKVLFPRSTDLRLRSAIDAVTGAVVVEGLEADLADAFGNTGVVRYLGIGSEAIRYTGYTAVDTNVWALTGVTRGTLGSSAAAQSAGAAAQRIGRYEGVPGYVAAADLIDNHTEIDAAYRDAAQWDAEGSTWMGLSRIAMTVVEPTPVDKLLGGLGQQCQFAIWWNARARTIPLLANHPPQEDPVVLTDDLNILEGSPGRSTDPDAMVTRVLVRYAPRDPFKLKDAGNYKFARLRIEPGIEAPEAANTIRELVIDAPWLLNEFDAIKLCASIIRAYKYPPDELSVELDAKDGGLDPGDVADILTRVVVDSQGAPVATRWQAIKVEETVAGHRFAAKFQSFDRTGRYGYIMANTAPDYTAASDAQKARGCFLADPITGLMSDGSPPYLLQ